MLYASPSNPGAAAAAEGLVLALIAAKQPAASSIQLVERLSSAVLPNELRKGADSLSGGDGAATATHMLLYLDKHTFMDAEGERLAATVRALRAAKLPIVLLHAKDSCEFGLFFTSTPQDLISDGLYKTVALELLPSPHDMVSAVHLAKALGATHKAAANQASRLVLSGVEQGRSALERGSRRKVHPRVPRLDA